MDLNEIRLDLEEIRPDLDEVLPNLDKSSKTKPVNHSNREEQQFLVCFSIRSFENRFFMLKPVNRLAGLGFWGRIPIANRHQRRVGWFSSRIGRVGQVGQVPCLVGHPYYDI